VSVTVTRILLSNMLNVTKPQRARMGASMSTTRLAIEQKGSGLPIVLLHGLTFSRRTWDPIVDRLSQRHHTITVDLPGHGESDGSAADPQAVGARLHATLTSLGVHRPVVVGHSAGAMLASGYASAFPTSGVVNVDQPLLIGGFASFLQQVAVPLRSDDFENAFAPFEASIGVDRLPEGERERVSATRRIRQEVVLDHWTLPMTTKPKELQDTIDSMLGAIKVPYLYLGGDEPPTPVTDHLHGHLQQLHIEIWPGHGHLVHLAEPESFARLVSDFAAECNRASGGQSKAAAPAG
jgi:pimeloyl-ACP methyl ester carboxylesterase